MVDKVDDKKVNNEVDKVVDEDVAKEVVEELKWFAYTPVPTCPLMNTLVMDLRNEW